MSQFPAMPALTSAFAFLLAGALFLVVLRAFVNVHKRLPSSADEFAMTGFPGFAAESSSFIQRCDQLWHHQARNIPLFLLFALLSFSYVMLHAPQQSAHALFASFVVLCYLDCALYLAMHPRWSMAAYLGAWIVCWIMAVQILMLMFWHW